MGNRFVIADTHFGHRGIIEFTDVDGDRYRPFMSIQDHDDYICQRYCEMVGKKDTVYFLGDLGWGKEAIRRVGTLPGQKILIKGNHDDQKLKHYVDVFDDVRSEKSVRVMLAEDVGVRALLTHRPLHTMETGVGMTRKGYSVVNIHGHIHALLVPPRSSLNPAGMDRHREDIFYFNACLEYTGFQPMAIDDIMNVFRQRLVGGDLTGYRNPVYKDMRFGWENTG